MSWVSAFDLAVVSRMPIFTLRTNVTWKMGAAGWFSSRSGWLKELLAELKNCLCDDCFLRYRDCFLQFENHLALLGAKDGRVSEICRIPEKMGRVVIFSFPFKESKKGYFLPSFPFLLTRDMNLKSAIYRIIMSRKRIFHRMTTTFSVGAVLFWSNSDLTLGECQHNDGHTPTACTTITTWFQFQSQMCILTNVVLQVPLFM